MVERCVATAGFSVGELTALAFSGAVSLEDGQFFYFQMATLKMIFVSVRKSKRGYHEKNLTRH